MNTEPIVIPIHGDPSDFVADSKRVVAGSNEMGNAADIAAKKGAIFSTVLATTSAILKKSYDDYSKLAESVRDLSLVNGESAESTSRFIQVLDDYQLTAADATTAAKKLKDQGLTPTVETLAMLSDQFKGIKDPAERLDFVYDKLGKSGAKFINMLDQGGDAIRANAAAINESLILNDLEIKMYEVGRLAIDEKTDALLAFRVELGQNIGNVLAFAAAMERATEIQAESVVHTGRASKATITYDEALNMAIAEQLKAADASAEYKYNLEEQEAATKAAEEALKELSKANKEYLSDVGSITKEIDNYKEKESDLKTTHADLLAEKQTLISQGWWAESDAILEINDKLAENEQAQAQNAEAFDLATKSRMLSMLQEQLSIDGLDKKETEFLLQQGLKWGIYSQEAIDAMAAVQRQVDAMERNIDININVRTNYSTAGQAALTTQLAGEKDYVPKRKNATGGTYMIPESYGNEGFMMSGGDTASGGERLQIIPKGQAAGGMVVNIMLDSATPDPERVAYNLKPAVERVIRELQQAGRV